MDEDAQLIGQTIAGRYEVTGLLGTGGMGAVYVAKQMPLGRQVALKVIRPGLITDSQAVERFKREATIVSQLLHPNIVTVFDFGQAERGLLFIAMELLPGENLRQRLRRAGAMSWQLSLSVVRDIASGLAAAHAKGVIHRDLKPDNVMLIEAGRPDFVKLLDFGVAKLTEYNGKDGNITNTGMLVGTPGYMAPEAVLKGITTDPRSDLYAVGVLWFEMLTGATMFTAPTPVALVMKHATERPPRIGELRPSSKVPIAVENLVQKLIAKDPDERPPDARSVVAACEHMLRFGDEMPEDPFSSGAYRLISTGSMSMATQAPLADYSEESSEPTQVNRRVLEGGATDEDFVEPSAATKLSSHEPLTRTYLGESPEHVEPSPAVKTPETGSTPRPTIGGQEISMLPEGSDTLDSLRQAGVSSSAPKVIAAVLGLVLAAGVAYSAWWWFGQRAIPDPVVELTVMERCDNGEGGACAEAATSSDDLVLALALHKRACDAGVGTSCQAASEATEDDVEKQRLAARACELGVSALCEEAPVVEEPVVEEPVVEEPVVEEPVVEEPVVEEPVVEEPVVKPDPIKRKPRWKPRVREPKVKVEPKVEPKVKPKIDRHVPDLILDDKKKPKDRHVPDLITE